MLKEKRNSRVQGDVGLGEAIAWFIRNDYTVCIPVSDSQRYDLVVEKNDDLQKVEVKTTYHQAPSGSYKARLITRGGNQSWSGKTTYFSSSEVDLLFIFTEDNTKYLLPANKANRATITLGKLYDKYKIE